MVKARGKIDREKVGKKIQKYMDLQGLKASDMVRITGLHRDTLYRILRGNRGMTMETAAIIAEALDIPISVLVD
jgi:plasmid maintenance system antidote protein VapI